MICDECGKREAVVHSAVNINNHVSEMHLCGECYKKHGESLINNLNSGLGNLFSGLTGGEQVQKKKQQMCPKCGTTLDEFLRTSYLGCENCYKEFAQVLRPVILKTQGKLVHTGKIPNPTEEDNARREYQRLGAELRKAVEEERYEDAAGIKRAMNELGNGGVEK